MRQSTDTIQPQATEALYSGVQKAHRRHEVLQVLPPNIRSELLSKHPAVARRAAQIDLDDSVATLDEELLEDGPAAPDVADCVGVDRPAMSKKQRVARVSVSESRTATRTREQEMGALAHPTIAAPLQVSAAGTNSRSRSWNRPSLEGQVT